MQAVETFLTGLDDDANGSDALDVETLETAATGLPDGAKVTGIVDEDGDGRDDDGLVSVTADGAWACVTLPKDGDDGDVGGGACS